jgi:hypothetical protein
MKKKHLAKYYFIENMFCTDKDCSSVVNFIVKDVFVVMCTYFCWI